MHVWEGRASCSQECGVRTLGESKGVAVRTGCMHFACASHSSGRTLLSPCVHDTGKLDGRGDLASATASNQYYTTAVGEHFTIAGDGAAAARERPPRGYRALFRPPLRPTCLSPPHARLAALQHACSCRICDITQLHQQRHPLLKARNPRVVKVSACLAAMPAAKEWREHQRAPQVSARLAR